MSVLWYGQSLALFYLDAYWATFSPIPLRVQWVYFSLPSTDCEAPYKTVLSLPPCRSKHKANNAYPWDPSFAAGGQNHRLTSSFDILPGSVYDGYEWINAMIDPTALYLASHTVVSTSFRILTWYYLLFKEIRPVSRSICYTSPFFDWKGGDPAAVSDKDRISKPSRVPSSSSTIVRPYSQGSIRKSKES
ncbi:hypothetical protein Lal_00002289 [Lupinus albus]|nr:hypothetical protein Lal_00002289 [Lupinus albus]